jgi:dihydroflavonol-4-reductase
LRVAGAVMDRAGRFLPFDTPFTSAGMQYYTQMPASDDSPSERELGITYRDPKQTVADTFEALRAPGA